MFRGKRWIFEGLVVSIFSLAAYLIHYCYPVPQISWDSNYYVVTGATGEAGIRPNGYAVFLDLLHSLYPRFGLVVLAQYVLFYFGVRFFALAVVRSAGLPWFLAHLLMAVLLLDPVSLFHCNAILSDSLFTSLSLTSLATLIHFLRSGRLLHLALHVLLVMACIEVRHIALFYPFFSCLSVVIWGGSRRLKAIAVGSILTVYFTCFVWHVNQHEKMYGVAVYSPFSGWTHANNALYALPDIAPAEIEDIEVRRMHEEFARLIEEKNFIPAFTGSGFLWEDNSPLNIVRYRIIDSTGADYTLSWFLCAERFAKYGTYIQRHFPLRYIKAFMLPNLETMYSPALGEMENYKITPLISPFVLDRYGISLHDLEPRKNPYERRINPYLIYLYRAQLWLFLLSAILFAFRFRSWQNSNRRTISLLICFVIVNFGLMLYSSWFMYRYLMSVTPLMWAVTLAITYIYWERYLGRPAIRSSSAK